MPGRAVDHPLEKQLAQARLSVLDPILEPTARPESRTPLPQAFGEPTVAGPWQSEARDSSKECCVKRANL